MKHVLTADQLIGAVVSVPSSGERLVKQQMIMAAVTLHGVSVPSSGERLVKLPV